MNRKNLVQVGTIENTGPNTLISFLQNAGSGTTGIDVAVAFVTSTGIDALLYLLKKTATKGQVRLLTGLYQGFTEPKALRALLREQEETKGRLSVRLSLDKHFHWKSYFLVKKDKATVVIGSSNLTKDGLCRTGELNAVISLAGSSTEYVDLHRPFEQHWGQESSDLSEKVIGKYEKWRSKADLPSHRLSVPISKILSGTGGKQEPEREPTYWLSYIDRALADKTVSLIDETTDWDDRGLWYCTNDRQVFRTGDRVIFFDLMDKLVQAARVVATTTTPIRTSNGYHFAACRKIRGVSQRRLVPNRWKSLKAAGLLKTKSSVETTRRLQKFVYERYVDNLKQVASPS